MRLFLVALLAASLCTLAPALAGTVTSPTGGTHSVMQPLTGTWVGVGVSGGTTSAVDIELMVNGSSTLLAPIAQNVANTGQYTISSAVLRAGVCQTLPVAFQMDTIGNGGFGGPYPVSHMTFYFGVRSSTHPNDYAFGKPFKMTCPLVIGTALPNHQIFHGMVMHPLGGHELPNAAEEAARLPNDAKLVPGQGFGSLHIYKSVGYTSGLPVPPNFPSFAMSVTCTPLGPTNQSVTVPTNPAGLTIGGIAANSVCVVSEPAPPLIPHAPDCGGGVAHWETNSPQSATIAANATANVTVNNSTQCGKPSGWIMVHKTVVNTTGVIVPSHYAMVAHCQESTGASTVSLLIQNGSWESFGSVEAGGSCQIVEAPLATIAHAPGCKGGNASWTTSYAPSQTAVAAAGVLTHITVTNRLACDSASQAGHVTLHKIVVNATGGPAAIPPSFNVTVHCTPSGPLATTLPVPANGGVSLAAPVAANSLCSASEHVPVSIAHVRGCKGGAASWTTAVSPAVHILAGHTSSLTVTNRLTCDKPAETGALTIFKKVVNDASIPLPDINFYVDVACHPGGPSETVKLNNANGYHDTVSGIAMGVSCTISEQPPAVSADLAKRGCHWETSYPDHQSITIRNREALLTIVNHWLCKPGSDNGAGTETGGGTGTEGRRHDFSIRKSLENSDWQAGSTGVFHLVVTNNGVATHPPISLVVSDTLPAGMTLVAAAGSGWTCSASSPVTCTYGGAVGAGQTLPAITITAMAGKPGGMTNCATVALIGAQDVVPPNDKACVEFKIGKVRRDKDSSDNDAGPADSGKRGSGESGRPDGNKNGEDKGEGPTMPQKMPNSGKPDQSGKPDDGTYHP